MATAGKYYRPENEIKLGGGHRTSFTSLVAILQRLKEQTGVRPCTAVQ
jgi:hypothetical protein